MAGLRLLAGGRPRFGGGLVFAYHDVGRPGPEFTRYSVSPARLRRQLEAARRSGLRFVALGEMVDVLAADRDPEGLAAVCFDDCLAGVHRYALPVLAEMGVPATIFAVSDAFGARPPWWPGAARVVTRAELAELVAAGWTVGSHSRNHPSLIELGRQALADEVGGSRHALQDLLGQPVDLFAYPYGHHDPTARQAVATAGYRAAFSFLGGRVLPSFDLHQLPRLNMHQGLGRLRLARQVARAPGQWPETQLDVVRHQEQRSSPSELR
jgi:peptidoglycan/xylan/chitin deacetylase (PgdA/CDA1 family)